MPQEEELLEQNYYYLFFEQEFCLRILVRSLLIAWDISELVHLGQDPTHYQKEECLPL